jgi:primase-polymerase (primpol)-like protein
VALTKLRRWVVWKWEQNKQNKWTKVPYQPAKPEHHAKNNDSQTWGDYATAIAAYRDQANAGDGIGFMLFKGDVAALDLDKCRNVESEELALWAQAYVDEAKALGAYVEVTVSGTGLRIIG